MLDEMADKGRGSSNWQACKHSKAKIVAADGKRLLYGADEPC